MAQLLLQVQSGLQAENWSHVYLALTNENAPPRRDHSYQFAVETVRSAISVESQNRYKPYYLCWPQIGSVASNDRGISNCIQTSWGAYRPAMRYIRLFVKCAGNFFERTSKRSKSVLTIHAILPRCFRTKTEDFFSLAKFASIFVFIVVPL